MDDFTLFCKNFVHIVDNAGELVKLDLNDQQIEFNDIVDEHRFSIVAKSRQLGFSVYALARAYFIAISKPNSNIMIVSYKEDSARELFNRLKRMNQYLPREKYPNLFPDTVRDNRNELILSNGSSVTSVTAGNKDIGRGSTYTMIHLSEFAFYGNQEKQLLSAEQALAKSDDSRLIIETTSNGIGNHYYKLFMSAYRGHSKYIAYFAPFYSSGYKKMWADEYEEAWKWYRSYFKPYPSVKDLDEDEKILHEKGATLKQIAWRQWKLMDMDLQEFWQEFPSNPMESFVSSGNSVFDQNKIMQRINYIMPAINKKEIKDIPDGLRKYIGKELYIYHEYDQKKKYYAGIDTATASSGTGDYSTITILDEEGVEVASFGSNKLPVYKFAEVANDLLRHYGQAFVAIERNNVGIVLIEKLRDDYDYLNMYKEKLFDQKGKRRKQLGFTTTKTSKPILIEKFKEQFELGYILLNDKETLEQMQIYQINDSGKMGNSGAGNNDDKVISAALSVLAKLENKWYV